jgi:hypothetical protein
VNGKPHFPELVRGREPYQWVDNQPFTKGSVVGSAYQKGVYGYDEKKSTAVHLETLEAISVPVSHHPSSISHSGLHERGHVTSLPEPPS